MHHLSPNRLAARCIPFPPTSRSPLPARSSQGSVPPSRRPAKTPPRRAPCATTWPTRRWKPTTRSMPPRRNSRCRLSRPTPMRWTLCGSPACRGSRRTSIRRCRAQGNSMLRTAQGAVRALERRQATREKAQNAMHPAAMERAGYWFKSVSMPEATPQPPPPEAAEPDGDLVPRGGSVRDHLPAASGADPHPGPARRCTGACDRDWHQPDSGARSMPPRQRPSHRAGASRAKWYNETYPIRLSAGKAACR